MPDDSLKQYLNSIPVQEKTRETVLKVPLDSQNTTLGSFQRLIIQDKYTNNLDLSGLQQGVIVKVITEPKEFDYSSKNELETRNQNKRSPIRYKVFVQGPAGSVYPIPENLNSTAIKILDDYSTTPDITVTLTERQIVFVDIVDKIIHFVNDQTIYSHPSGSNKNPSDSYKKSSSSPTTVGQEGASGAPTEPTKIIPPGPIIKTDNIPQDIVKEEAWKNGVSIGLIELKKIVSYSSQLLRSDAADAFNQMCIDAKKQNILLYASSGFRSHSLQIKLYNERYTKPYPTPKNENTISDLGRTKGVAAYPGTSNHQSGIAVDLDVGVSKKEFNRYAGDMGKDPRFVWLSKNALKYGFSNSEGKSVNEPWHWVYTK